MAYAFTIKTKICSCASNNNAQSGVNRVTKSEQERTIMTREQAKNNLIACGVAEPTDEQITSYLNQVNGAIKVEKDRADRMKTEADKVQELQAALEEINNKGLSDVEKANKVAEAAEKKAAELEKTLHKMEVKNKLAEKGIIGEQADNLFDEAGNLNFDVLGQILSDREASAAAKKEAELAGSADNPGSGNGNDDDGDSEGAMYAAMFNSAYES